MNRLLMFVAQIFNLLYRRFSTCAASLREHDADCKSAVQSRFEIGRLRALGNLRYGARAVIAFGAAFLLALPQRTLACSACYGASDAPMARGMNWGILSLLAIVGVVLGSVASFFVYIGVRSVHAPEAAPPAHPPESTTKH